MSDEGRKRARESSESSDSSESSSESSEDKMEEYRLRVNVFNQVWGNLKDSDRWEEFCSRVGELIIEFEEEIWPPVLLVDELLRRAPELDEEKTAERIEMEYIEI